MFTSVKYTFEEAAKVTLHFALIAFSVRRETFSVVRSEQQAWAAMVSMMNTRYKQRMRDLALVSSHHLPMRIRAYMQPGWVH